MPGWTMQDSPLHYLRLVGIGIMASYPNTSRQYWREQKFIAEYCKKVARSIAFHMLPMLIYSLLSTSHFKYIRNI